MKRAFSLTELMIVLSIIAIIMGTMKVHIQNKKLQAEVKSIVECVKIYESAVSMYYLRNDGTFPADISNLDAYLPTGFKSPSGTSSVGFQSISPGICYNGDYNMLISAYDKYGEKLLREVQKQLKEFAVDSQIDFQINYGARMNPDGTVHESPSKTYITYWLKRGDNVYI